MSKCAIRRESNCNLTLLVFLSDWCCYPAVPISPVVGGEAGHPRPTLHRCRHTTDNNSFLPSLRVAGIFSQCFFFLCQSAILVCLSPRNPPILAVVFLIFCNFIVSFDAALFGNILPFILTIFPVHVILSFCPLSLLQTCYNPVVLALMLCCKICRPQAIRR